MLILRTNTLPKILLILYNLSGSIQLLVLPTPHYIFFVTSQLDIECKSKHSNLTIVDYVHI